MTDNEVVETGSMIQPLESNISNWINQDLMGCTENLGEDIVAAISEELYYE